MGIERRIGRNGNVSFTARLYVSQSSPKVSLGTFKRRTDAEAALRRGQDLVAEGVSPSTVHQQAKKVAFKAFVENEFLPSYSGNTAADYKVSCNLLIGWFGARPLDEIDGREVRKFLASLGNKGDGTPYSRNYQRKVAQRLRQVFNLAVKDGLLDAARHPYVEGGFSLPAKPKNRRVKLDLTKEAARWILETLRQWGDRPGTEGARYRYWYHLLTLAMHTGMRRSELLGIQDSAFDYHSRRIAVPSQWGWSKETPFVEVKSHESVRRIPLAPHIFDRVWVYVLESEGRPLDLVFPRLSASGEWALWLSESNFSKQYKKVMEEVWGHYEATVTSPKPRLKRSNIVVNMHQWRHLMATTALSNSVPVMTVSKWLGHSDPGFTYEVYSSFIEDNEERDALRLAEVFEERQGDIFA